MSLTTINPATGETIKEYKAMSMETITTTIDNADKAFQAWRDVPLDKRAKLLNALKDLLLAHKAKYAQLITAEMGKPITAATLEIEKCAWLCEHYATHGKHYLEPTVIKTDFQKSYITYEPLGVIFAIMPWNFPFWQVFRFAVPNLLLGNAALLKHAVSSTGVGLAIEALFNEAGFPPHLFATMVIEPHTSETIIRHPKIRGLTLTGSGRTGSLVGAQAAAALKKSVMELGGSDAFLVLDANDETALDHAAEIMVAARMAVSGQVCIAPKRVIVVKQHYTTFLTLVKKKLADYRPENPSSATCNLGPLARKDLRDKVHQQVVASVNAGAKCLVGGELPQGPGFYYPPTLLVDIPQSAPAYDEEIFGPVVSIFQVKDEDEAVKLANDTPYGLGASIFTQDIERGEYLARHVLNVGACTVNARVASDPRLPFGGIKNSGYGRELGQIGMLEFANVKTIQIA